LLPTLSSLWPSLDRQLEAVGRLAAGGLGDLRDRAQLGRAAQAVGAGHALGAEAQPAVALAAALYRGLAAQQARAGAAEAEAFLVEVDAPACTGQQRQVGAQLVHAASWLALDGGLVDVVQRQVHAQQRHRPWALVVASERPSHSSSGEPRTKRSRSAPWPRPLPSSASTRPWARSLMPPFAAELVAQHACAAVAQRHAAALEHQLRVHALHHRPVRAHVAGRHIGQRDALGLGGHAEQPGAARRVVGEVGQLAAQAHADVVRLAGQQRARRVVAGLWQAQRHVACHLGGGQALGLAAEVQEAGAAAAARAPPQRVELAGEVGRLQRQLAQPHLQLARPRPRSTAASSAGWTGG
jgi:hypothetical protein